MSRSVPPEEVWVDLRLVVRMSPIDGRGLFAVGPVPEGTVVVRLGDEMVDEASRKMAVKVVARGKRAGLARTPPR